MKHIDDWHYTDTLMGTLSKSTIVKEAVLNEASLPNSMTLEEKNDIYTSTIKSLLYFDIRDLEYWLWMHLLVCLFFIGETAILSFYGIYSHITVITLCFVFCQFIFYFYLMIKKDKKRSMKLFQDSTIVIAFFIYILHFIVVWIDGLNKSIFFPGLLMLTSTILGLPRDSGKKNINKEKRRFSFKECPRKLLKQKLDIFTYFIPLLSLLILILSWRQNHTTKPSFINSQDQIIQSIIISIWILIISTVISIILRKKGSKHIVSI